MENKSNKGLIWLIVILIILVIGLISFICYKEFYVEKNNSDNNTTKKAAEEKLNGKFSQSNNKYILDIANYNNKDEVYYELNNDYEVKLVFEFDENNYRTYDIYVNNKFIEKDENMYDDTVSFYKVGENLVYLNTGFTDIRSEHVYIIDKNININKIYQLDKITGMVPSEITVNQNNIIIKGTRLTHGPSIVYNESDMDDALLDDNTTWSEYGITENTVIEATYTYNLDSNNNINLKPNITNEITIKEYLNNN